MVELAPEFWVHLASVIVEMVIVILLIRTVKDYAEVAKASRVQVKQMFRPWVGPITGIDFLRESEGKYQFSIAVKNFGGVPATDVTASSIVRSEIPSRDLISNNKKGNDEKFDSYLLGPLLPNMEKRYWLFIDVNMMQKVMEGFLPLYTLIIFTYEFEGGTSSYGMISQYDAKTKVFVHKDMWVC